MTIGLVPITGIPLPFISYGGSFVLSCCVLQGLVQSVYRFRKEFPMSSSLPRYGPLCRNLLRNSPAQRRAVTTQTKTRTMSNQPPRQRPAPGRPTVMTTTWPIPPPARELSRLRGRIKGRRPGTVPKPADPPEDPVSSERKKAPTGS